MARWFIDRFGYRRFSDSGKSVSRWVASKKLGRFLGSKEVVHHKNRNKLDNEPVNLSVFSSQKKHVSYHRKCKKKTGQW